MDRTVRATLLAAFIGFAVVTGVLLFLAIPPGSAIVIGAVVGVACGVLIWGASRRADSFHPTDEVTPVEPGFPGPPEHGDDQDDPPAGGPR